MIGGMDAERGTITAGGWGYYLMGAAVALQQAQTLMAKDFTPLYTPFFMRKDIMQEVAQLSQFDEFGKTSSLRVMKWAAQFLTTCNSWNRILA